MTNFDCEYFVNDEYGGLVRRGVRPNAPTHVGEIPGIPSQITASDSGMNRVALFANELNEIDHHYEFERNHEIIKTTSSKIISMMVVLVN